MIRSGPSRKGVTQWSRKFLGGPRYLEIPVNANVLIVEDSLERIIRFKTWLPNARLAASASQAIAEIQKDVPEILFLDRDLIGPSYGEEVANFLVAQKFAGRRRKDRYDDTERVSRAVEDLPGGVQSGGIRRRRVFYTLFRIE